MRRFAMVFAIAFTGVLSSYAQPDSGMGTMMGKMDSTPMCCMMMHFMKPSSAFATEDGGFVIIVGNKVMKFDKEANLKREIELKIDTAAMNKMMQQMKACPMMKKNR